MSWLRSHLLCFWARANLGIYVRLGEIWSCLGGASFFKHGCQRSRRFLQNWRHQGFLRNRQREGFPQSCQQWQGLFQRTGKQGSLNGFFQNLPHTQSWWPKQPQDWYYPRQQQNLPKETSDSGNTNQPFQLHITITIHRCEICGKEFSRRNNLVSHKNIHTGEKSFPCKVCGKKFRRRSHLQDHG